MRLREIAIYPLKSGRAKRPSSARVTPIGLAGDRELMVVDDEGVFVTQREHPELALVAAELDGDLARLSVPSGDEVVAAVGGGGPTREVVVWRSRCQANDGGDAAAALLTRHLGRAVRLVRLDPTFRRAVNPRYGRESDVVSFADGYPLLVATLASLGDLNERLDEPVSMDRFRANLVVDGELAWGEDDWATLETGEALFDVVKPCDRCVMVNTDQATAARSPEVLKTLGAFRRSDRGILFGQNLIPRRLGTVRVGDEVRVTRHGQPV